VAGTKDGITALQMDIKITSITREIHEVALDQAKSGRCTSWTNDKVLSKPRKTCRSGRPHHHPEIDPEKSAMSSARAAP